MCIFIIKNGKRVVALALVPFIAINIYAGSKFFKSNEATKIGKDKKSSTIEMVDRTDYRTITLASDEKEVEQIVVKIKEEENVFEKLQQIYL
ncbi:MAG: hypothetical protein K2H20_00835, partial [Bacilli bacterium]|nr:hypothetical protein [Bacilli bacterium]